MKQESGATHPIWEDNISLPTTDHLRENRKCDVCVVGAGIAGLTVAYLLAKEGKHVIVLESKSIGGGESSRTAAHLSTALDARYTNLINTFGEDGTRLICQSHTRAIDKVSEIAKEEKIDCDFTRVDGYLFASTRQDEEKLLKELEAIQQFGWMDVVLRKECPAGSLTALPCLHFPNQARLHPMKYLAGLAKAFIDKGGEVYTDTHVVDFKSGPVVTATAKSGHAVSANHLVVATNAPANDKATIMTKQAPYRTYMIGLTVPKDVVPDALYWDVQDPYHYIRLAGNSAKDDGDTEILLVGGEDHRTGQENNPMKRFQDLERWTRTKFPMAGEVRYLWSGQVQEPVDGLAYIGRYPCDFDNMYVATGDSGQDVTHATIGGILITDLIMGRKNPWAKLYDPTRSGMKGAGEFMKYNLNVATQAKDYVTPGEVEDPAQVMPGTGGIMRDGTNKVAVYCDQDGVRHKFSAVCTHMGCLVHWNNVEHSWDCPCHGSRYDPLGRVVTGPARKDLDPLK
ncbi:glycine/D-amino acid oxidase-like deaminating enzyme [Pontibacter ummariensis]|uniref:Glycine/D-amino acid oxidase n=1 Tax=Pontibacter ummariensis TaxID=1610492 RepID=A0A239L4V6_9BACT|nr:FAD-dependent oxidoreductase [Pontibacter ummariensis]PRY04278.1 glycine/D-amino acid oxidase-like deaminating enzyme [Pontibacter ummariensis]SNT25647.1 Glycine/D-amino acid oxidase [Pontibacter ummariensis]